MNDSKLNDSRLELLREVELVHFRQDDGFPWQEASLYLPSERDVEVRPAGRVDTLQSTSRCGVDLKRETYAVHPVVCHLEQRGSTRGDDGRQ